MNKDNVFPLSPFISPPEDDDEALKRISEFAGMSLSGLVGLFFKDDVQFERCMKHSGFKVESDVILDAGRFKTILMEIVAKDGMTSIVIGTQMARSIFRIDNAKTTKKGETTNDKDWATLVDLYKDISNDQ